jgi:hypothetical protein
MGPDNGCSGGQISYMEYECDHLYRFLELRSQAANVYIAPLAALAHWLPVVAVGSDCTENLSLYGSGKYTLWGSWPGVNAQARY